RGGPEASAMSYELRLNTGEEAPLATIRGWGDFCRWADTLDTELFTALIHLAEYGWSQDFEAVGGQLRSRVEGGEGGEGPPDVRPTAEHLLKVLRSSEAQAAVVTQGIDGDGAGEDAKALSSSDETAVRALREPLAPSVFGPVS